MGVVHTVHPLLMPQTLQRWDNIFKVTVDLMASLVAHLDGKGNAIQQLHCRLILSTWFIGVSPALYRHKIHRRNNHNTRLPGWKIKLLVLLFIVKRHRAVLHSPTSSLFNVSIS